MAVSPGKAKEMLKDGTAHGRPLTRNQRRYFATVASGHRQKFKRAVNPRDVYK